MMKTLQVTGILTTIAITQRGESFIYTGSDVLPAKSTYPTFASYHEAEAYANKMYEKEIVDGEDVVIFKSGNKKKGNLRYVVGLYEDRANKKLPQGSRWECVVL